ncbi:AAA family ATPase [Rhizobium sp.]
MKQSPRLPAPYLKRIWLDQERAADRQAYPFTVPLFAKGNFEFDFRDRITIIVGENGTGKSTLLEAIAALVGFDQSGGGNGYRPLDHSRSLEGSGDPLGKCFRASWLPKVSNGWFFKAETFFSVARYLDEAALDAHEAPPDFLSHSHGEGFLRFFHERCQRRGVFIFDEPESALSPQRQIEFVKLLNDIERAGQAQVIIATHSPLIMAFPAASLWEIKRDRLDPIEFRQTGHYRIFRAFFENPEAYLRQAMENEREG